MVKGLHGQNLPADVAQVVDQLERHCMGPDGSLISKPLYNDLQLVSLSLFLPLLIFMCLWNFPTQLKIGSSILSPKIQTYFFFATHFVKYRITLVWVLICWVGLQAREEMCRERLRYLEAMVKCYLQNEIGI